MLGFVGDHFFYLVLAAFAIFAATMGFVTVSDGLSRR